MLPYRYACMNLPAKYPNLNANANANANMNITFERARYVPKATLSQFRTWLTEREKEIERKWERWNNRGDRGCSFSRHLFSFTANLKVPRVSAVIVTNTHTHIPPHTHKFMARGGVGGTLFCANLPMNIPWPVALTQLSIFFFLFCVPSFFSVTLHKLPIAQILINILPPPPSLYHPPATNQILSNSG